MKGLTDDENNKVDVAVRPSVTSVHVHHVYFSFECMHNLVGSYDTACFAQKLTILASPLLAWTSERCRIKLVQSMWRRGTSALLHYNITTAICLVLYCRTP